MTLVEILAREMDAWPEGVTHACVGSGNDCSERAIVGISFTRNGPPIWDGKRFSIMGSPACVYWDVDSFIPYYFGLREHPSNIVTREMWEAERRRIMPGYCERARKESPAQPQSSGEGLPNVGTVCEIRIAGQPGWHKATIKYASANVVVWKWPEQSEGQECCSYWHAIDTRPIDTRTPREKWIDLADAAIHHGLSVQHNLGDIWDAGLAKLPEDGE